MPATDPPGRPGHPPSSDRRRVDPRLAPLKCSASKGMILARRAPRAAPPSTSTSATARGHRQCTGLSPSSTRRPRTPRGRILQQRNRDSPTTSRWNSSRSTCIPSSRSKKPVVDPSTHSTPRATSSTRSASVFGALPRGKLGVVKDDVDKELATGLANTSESSKRALIMAAVAAREAGKAAARRERWIVRLAAATLIVAVVTLIVSLLR